MRVDLSDLYLLGEAFERGAARADFTCSTDDVGKWVSGERTQTIALKQCEGRRLCDLMVTTHTLDLISNRIQSALLEESITGWATCPVVLKDRKGELIPDYAALATTGRCGPLVNSRSKKVTKENYAGTGFMDVYLGYYFDEDSWDGSDMFRPEGTRMTIVTRHVRDIIMAIKATNIEFEPILEVERLEAALI